MRKQESAKLAQLNADCFSANFKATKFVGLLPFSISWSNNKFAFVSISFLTFVGPRQRAYTVDKTSLMIVMQLTTESNRKY